MSERRAEPVTPKPVGDQTLCVVVPVAVIESLGTFVAAGLQADSLRILRAIRNGPRRLERIER